MSVGGKAHKRPRKPRQKQPPGWKVKDPVPLAPLREAFLERLEAGDVTASEVAIRAGFVEKDGRPGTSQLSRRLQLKPHMTGRKRNGKQYISPHHDLINYDIAARICRGLGLMPVDIKDENGESIL